MKTVLCSSRTRASPARWVRAADTLEKWTCIYIEHDWYGGVDHGIHVGQTGRDERGVEVA
jgi:hypothetical protein